MNFPTIKLPSRALSLARGVISIPRVYFFTTPIMLLITAFLVVTEGPGIISG